MRRRDFLGLFGGSILLSPRCSNAQQQTTPTVGVLVLGNPDPEPFLTTLRNGLRTLGYAEGRNIRFEIRNADRRADLLPNRAAELVALKVDIIVVWQTQSALAAKAATSSIPIVMAAVGDPISTGLVASLASPGGNITGNTNVGSELMRKNVEFIREVLPSGRRIAIFVNAPDPFGKPFLSQTEEAAKSVGFEVEVVMTNPLEDVEVHYERIIARQVEAVIIQPSLLRPAIIAHALKHKLPAFAANAELPRLGGLMSYSGVATDQWNEAAAYVTKILKGARPADLPVAQPTRFQMVINMQTARHLGLTISPILLARADEVIE